MLVNVQELGCFSIFWRADDVTRTMSKGGGVLVNVFTPPSGNPVSAPVFHLSKFRPPPHLDGWLRACIPYVIANFHAARIVENGGFSLTKETERKVRSRTLMVNFQRDVNSKIDITNR